MLGGRPGRICARSRAEKFRLADRYLSSARQSPACCGGMPSASGSWRGTPGRGMAGGKSRRGLYTFLPARTLIVETRTIERTLQTSGFETDSAPLYSIRWAAVIAGLAVGLGAHLVLLLLGIAGLGCGRPDGSSLSIAAARINVDTSTTMADLLSGLERGGAKRGSVERLDERGYSVLPCGQCRRRLVRCARYAQSDGGELPPQPPTGAPAQRARFSRSRLRKRCADAGSRSADLGTSARARAG